MKLKSNEKLLKGNWHFSDKLMMADSTFNRIEWLINEYLIKLGEDEYGWDILYQDPEDNRYWELTYPDSDLHGGGAPQLENISIQKAEQKYRIKL